MIKITNCGYNSYHSLPCDIEHKNGLPHYLLLIVKSEAWVYINSEKIKTEPFMIILFDKNTYIHYGSTRQNYNDDWLHFSFEDDTEIEFLKSLEIPFNKPIYPPDIQRLSRFLQLATREFHFPANKSSLILDSLIKSFLYALSEDITRTDNLKISHKYYLEFLNLRKSIYNTAAKKRTSSEMARSLNLSVSYFQHLYKYFFSTTAQIDIITARLELAKFYLSTSNMSISALSTFCGYDNEIHFMRQFKKFEGVTPSEFRKNKNN